MITQIIWFFSWPVLILVSWFVIGLLVKKFEKTPGNN
jgi:hypothetical protein